MQGTRVYLLNALTLALSFSHIENILKIVLLLLSIVYTGIKILEFIKPLKK
jgi:hypothetical protein